MTPCDFCDRNSASHAVSVAHVDSNGRPICATTMNRCDVCRTHTNAADQRRGEDAVKRDPVRLDEMTIDERLAHGAGIDGTGVV